MLLTIDQIVSFTHAQTINASAEDLKHEACGITWDSREVEPGYVYVAFPGERVDGHVFVPDVCEKGASAVLVMQDLPDEAMACAQAHHTAVLKVASTTEAFTDLARGYRSCLTGRVIGITGSTGKTTTKNLVRDVLSSQFSTVATKANQNNELGVPRTLLNADPDTEMVVVEVGMRGQGQIASLCTFVKPDWGLVTNVGESHIELLGSRDNIARAKGELIEALPAGGVAFLNGANDKADFIWELAGKGADKTFVCFDGSGAYDEAMPKNAWRHHPSVWAEDVSLDHEGRPTFTLCARGFAGAAGVAGATGLAEAAAPADATAPAGPASDDAIERCPCTLSLRGVHNVSNACSAAAVGLAAGMALSKIAQALSAALPEQGRQEILDAPGGYTVINDAYNANPDSMRASLDLLQAMEIPGHRLAVLGDMGELGTFAQACHGAVGKHAAHASLDELICVGELARFIAQAAQAEGLDPDRVHVLDTRDEALALVKERIKPGDAVLIKASHFMELDGIAKELVG